MSDGVGVRYPGVVVKLSEENGNAGAIMGAVARGLRRGGASDEEVWEMRAEMMSGNYDGVLQTAMRWVTVE